MNLEEEEQELGLLCSSQHPTSPKDVVVESLLFSLWCGEDSREKVGPELFGAQLRNFIFPLS